MARFEVSLALFVLVLTSFSFRFKKFALPKNRIGWFKTATFSLVVLLTIHAFPSFAQVITPGNQTGLPTFGTFHGTDIESVSLQNQNLHIEIPIISIPQRGGNTLSWKYVYDSPSFQAVWVSQPTQQDRSAGFYRIQASPIQSRWRLVNSTFWELISSNVTVSCTIGDETFTDGYSDNYNVIDPSGTMHPVPLRKSLGQAHCGSGIQQNFQGTTLDGSGISVDISGPTTIIRLKDGTQVSPTTFEDTNGNMYAGADMLGRPGPLIETTTSTSKTWSYTDSSGQSQSFQVALGGVSGTTADCSLIPFKRGPCNEGGFGAQVPTSLTLPDGITTYTFDYTGNTHGELTGIGLPTGGTIHYSYSMAYFQDHPVLLNPAHAFNYTGHPQVTERDVNDGSVTSTWLYTGNASSVKVTMPTGDYEVHNVGLVGSAPYEMSVMTYDSGGNLLKTVTKDYASDVGPMGSGLQPEDINTQVDARVIRETTTLDNGLTSKTETDYDSVPYFSGFVLSRLNPIEKRYYDFGQGAPGALLKRVHYTYLHDLNPAYVTPNIVDRVAEIDTYDGSGNRVAQTINSYDSYSQGITPSGAVQHDPNFGTSFTLRGNVTSVSRWRNTDNSMLTTNYRYDDAGNVVASTDPKGNTTTYDYSDSWTEDSCPPIGGPAEAYLRQITNALGQTQTYSHYSCTGLVGSYTDPNKQPTSYSYDPMSRLLSVGFPDQGQKTATYHDTPIPATITEKELMSAGKYKTQVTTLDGMGRVKQTQLFDPEGTDYVDTTYDALGRTACVSNPYRSTTDPTYGNTCSSYDALNRIIRVLEPDGSKVATSYSGNCTTVTDAAGKSRKSCTDALGRLTNVWEDPTGVNYETDYQYDALDNLLSVIQKGGSSQPNWRIRMFSYDSLSRLLSATNPESGTITYSYDPNGNLVTKTDARGITTTMTYDVLNRVLTKRYSDGTPTATFYYDTPPAPWANTEQNTTGRLVEETTGITPESK